MKTFVMAAYVFTLGYMAKKYEIPSRVAEAVLDGTRALAATAGHAFASGMAPDALINDLFPADEIPSADT